MTIHESPFDSFTWRRLLAAWTMALRPARVGLGAIVLVIALAAAHSAGWKLDPAPRPQEWSLGALALDPIEGAYRATVRAFEERPVRASLATIALAIAWSLGGAAICRTAATEAARRERLAWPDALALALSRRWSLVIALLAPALMALLLVLALAVLGWAGMGWSVLRPVSGALFVVALLMGAALALAIGGYALGHALLVPAIACEGCDAIDAIQRAYAYAIARPFRLAMLVAVVGVQTLLAVHAAAWAAGAVADLTAWSSTRFIDGPAREIVLAAAGDPSWRPADGAGWTSVFAWRAARFWFGAMGVVFGGAAVSTFFCSSTLAYLLIRRDCDGQDPRDLWEPGQVAGTTASRRAAIAAHAIDDAAHAKAGASVGGDDGG